MALSKPCFTDTILNGSDFQRTLNKMCKTFPAFAQEYSTHHTGLFPLLERFAQRKVIERTFDLGAEGADFLLR